MIADDRGHRGKPEREQGKDTECDGPDWKRGQLFPRRIEALRRNGGASINHYPTMTARAGEFAGENRGKITATRFL